ncbi:hypothetical protein [Microbacterium sp. BH-3-3-3]|uniref:hypothetical protein n=1 Tax=Microbacterium sp. BH-3-3-3 TaxID=1906742 RepID=UPI0011A077BE|nr:hypothetical protein [Microbacterium sp. BH-3-3-3]
MKYFTASNGIEVGITPDGFSQLNLNPKGNRIVFGSSVSSFSPDTTAALREFFQAEADERLGRWRWPQNPQWVLYPDEDGDVVAMDESTGQSTSLLTRLTVSRFPNAEGCPAARAYFDAHPEPKPWQQAEAGELWELTVEGVTRTYASIASTGQNDVYIRFFPTHEVNAVTLGTKAPVISAGHRIFPEVSS